MSSPLSFKEELSAYQRRVDGRLNLYLASSDRAPQLFEAMKYSTFNGGKRLRPVLVYASCNALGGDLNAADPAAAAVEYVHAYSLIHDDLPAMDDDDLRRGMPTCHIAFDESTAILAGDALQTLAFETLSLPCQALAPAIQLKMLLTLAKASGDKGMVAGQTIDMEVMGKAFNLSSLEQMHRLKTGALMGASVRLGALASGCEDEQALESLERYAGAIGLAFQVQDDVLDIEGDTETLGKQQGADLALNKVTYPSLLGLDGAKQKAKDLHAQALDALTSFDEKALLLRQLADYVINRNH